MDVRTETRTRAGIVSILIVDILFTFGECISTACSFQQRAYIYVCLSIRFTRHIMSRRSLLISHFSLPRVLKMTTLIPNFCLAASDLDRAVYKGSRKPRECFIDLPISSFMSLLLHMGFIRPTFHALAILWLFTVQQPSHTSLYFALLLVR
jgi:hypothetical protein